MLRLQETKMGLSDAALGEGGGVKLHKLSVKQLKAVSSHAYSLNLASVDRLRSAVWHVASRKRRSS